MKENQTKFLDLKNTIIEFKNYQRGFNSQLDQAKVRINKLEDRSLEIIKSAAKEEKNEEKWREPNGFTEHHEAGKYGSPRKRREKERGRKSI